MLRYRLKAPVIAVEHLMGMRIRQLAIGQILTTAQTSKESGLVESVCEGRIVAVFIEDLRERGECVEAVRDIA